MASFRGSGPFYSTIWFTLLVTVALVAGLYFVAAAMPDVGGRPNKGIGQFGVVLIAIYWVLIFPKLRRGRAGGSASGDEKKNPKNN